MNRQPSVVVVPTVSSRLNVGGNLCFHLRRHCKHGFYVSEGTGTAYWQIKKQCYEMFEISV